MALIRKPEGASTLQWALRGSLISLPGWNGALVLKLERAPKPPGDSGDLGRGPRSSFSDRFPGDTDDRSRDLTSRSNGPEVGSSSIFLTVVYEHLYSFLSTG